ncbi:hypothetical protein LXL04_032120 [Taraxacum kok-saghyz]
MGLDTNRVEDNSGSGHAQPETTTVSIVVPPETMEPRELHGVCLPPKKTSFQKLRHKLSEIFFPDDPLHRFKNQTRFNKFLFALHYVFPIFQWAPTYNLTLFHSDVVAGLTIASLAIPQGISYAKLANLPPVIGLYSSFVPPLIYAVLGSSKHLAVGPVSIASLVMGTMLNDAVSYSLNPVLYLKLAFTATFFAGLFQASLGFLRLGFLIDFLSKATLVGFMAGAAVIVSMQQLKGLLGIVNFTTKMQIIPVLSSVIEQRDEWSWHAILIGFSFLACLLTTRQIGLRKPKLFLISAAAPLTSVILSTLLVALFKSQLHNIATIGQLKKGLNPSSLDMLYFDGEFLAVAVKTGAVTGLLSLTEGIAVGRTFAALKNYQVDGNKEMIAIGLMNMAGSCSSCYVTSGSFSRSAVNESAGGKTAMSNIVMALTVLVTLLFLMPLFRYTPDLILAAIIVTAVIGLIDYPSAFRLWKVDKLDFVACLSSFLGVLFVSVPVGLAIAVGVSLLKILLHVTRPNTYVLGNIPGTQIYQDLDRYQEAQRVPSFVIIGVEAPIYFANSNYLQERIMRWLREEEDWIAANNGTSLNYLIIDMTAVTAMDTSGLAMVNDLKKMLEKRSIQLVLTNPVGSVMEKLHKSKSLESFQPEGLYITVGEAVADISALSKAQF